MSSSRRALALLGLTGLLVFGVAAAWSRPPFLADDYWWLWLPLNNPHFAWTEPYLFARMPVSTLLTDALLKSGAWEAFPRGIMTLAFGIHALAFGILLQTLLERAGIALDRGRALLFFAVALLFCFQPDNYEIHLWPILSVDSLGELLLALAFRAKRLPVAVLLAVLALMFYDSFAFLLIGFAALLVAVTGSLDRRNVKPVARRCAGLVAVSGLLWVLGKLIAGWALGFLHHPPFETSPLQALRNLDRVIRTLWQIHFYKTNWVLTLLQGLAVIGLCARALRGRVISARLLGCLILVPLAAALPLCLNTYDAPRAFFGPQLVQALSLAFLALLVAGSPESSGQTPEGRPVSIQRPPHLGLRAAFLWPLLLLTAVYAIQWGRILAVKRANSMALDREAATLDARMAECRDPCVLAVPPPGQGLRNDWVLPRFVWTFYLDRLRILAFPGRKIRFEIRDR